MPALTQEQQDLKQAIATYLANPTPDHWSAYAGKVTPEYVLALLAQLEECQSDYGQAVDSVAQLQDEVLEVRAQPEASTAPGVPAQTGTTPQAEALQSLADQGQAVDVTTVPRKWNSNTLVARLYNEAPNLSVMVEAGARIQELEAIICHSSAKQPGAPGSARQGGEHDKTPHAFAMEGYAVACKFGVFEAPAFKLADEMYAAFVAAGEPQP